MLRPPCPSPSQDQRRELRCGGGVLKAETQGAVLGWAGLGWARVGVQREERPPADRAWGGAGGYILWKA